MAHPGHHGGGGALPSLASGFLHPLSGMDHMILALAMGWLAFSLGAQRAKLPAISFLAALAVGALCGRWISGGTGLEIAISLTILAAGGAMMRDRLRGLGMLSIVAVAGGLVHGLAHGAEALPGVSFATYAAGLLVSTALLLGAGGLLQHAFSRAGHPLVAIRVAGVFMIVAAVTSLIGIF
jgi:urease accessory protein